ncbi:MAG: YwiC-like family protein [Calditrichaeota bacterium]|nr:YwiC-like family protein [Calditrichota bacterium]
MTTRELKKVFPDEYGAWAMWIVPFLTGAQAAHVWNLKTVLWFLFLTLFYVLKNPFMEWAVKNPSVLRMHPERRSMILISSAFPLLVLGGSVWFFLESDVRSAIFVGGLAGFLGLIYIILDMKKRGRSLFGQWIGVFLLTLAAPVTSLVLGGVFSRWVIAVWLVNSLYFAHSIYTVRGWMNSRKRGAARQSVWTLFRPLFLYWALVLGLLAGAILLEWIPGVWWILSVPTTLFLGVFTAGLFRKITIRQIGFLEVAHTLVFVILFLILIP